MTQSNDKVTTPPGLLPFSWEEAQKRPDAVVTRGGSKVTMLRHNPDAGTSHQLGGWNGSTASGWGLDGRFREDGVETVCDLFLKPEVRETYQNTGIDGGYSKRFASLSQAVDEAPEGATAVICFTYEGGTLLDVQIVHRYNQEVSHEN